MLRSECLKLKNSSGFYLIAVFTVLELLLIPSYLWFGSNLVSMTDLSLMTMLVFPLLIAILSILIFEQESLANNFQEIKSTNKRVRVWLSKLVVVDLLLFFPSAMIWLVTGLTQGILNKGLLIASASWLLAIFLNHFHNLLNFVISRGGNIIISIIEILFILFASNKVLLEAYWCPVVLPVNFILTMRYFNLIVLGGWLFCCVVILALLVNSERIV